MCGDAMTEEIHVLINGEEYGPYSRPELQQYLAEHKIVHRDLVWTESLTQWVPVEEFLKKSQPELDPSVPPRSPTPSDIREMEDLFYRGITLGLGDSGVAEYQPAAFRCFLRAAELGHAEAQL
jgi:hypothetical protein